MSVEDNDLGESLLAQSRGEDAEAAAVIGKDLKSLERGDAGEEPLKNYSIFETRRYWTKLDFLMFFLGVIAAAAFGCIFPLQAKVAGNGLTGNVAANPDLFADKIQEQVPKIFYLGLLALVTGFFQSFLLNTVAERIVRRVKRACLRSLLQQEVSFFDGKGKTGETSTMLAEQSQILLKGFADSIGIGVTCVSMNIASFTVAFTTNAQVSLVLMCVVPALMLVILVLIAVLIRVTKRLDKANEEAGGFAEEILSSIQTVAAFCGEPMALSKYTTVLDRAERLGLQQMGFVAIGIFSIMLLLYSTFGLAFWYGSRLIADGSADFGTVVIAVQSCLLGAGSIAGAVPCFQGLAKSKIAVMKLFSIIDRKPDMYCGGQVRDSLDGKIEFKHVFFRYKSRPRLVLNDVNFSVTPGQSVALVGSSGCGKSTCIALLERFYDIDSGSITIGGRNIKEFDLKYLRSHIALVSQEPILFATTIAENVWLGMPGNDQVDMPKVEAACEASNAKTFIESFKKGYDTECGSFGTKLSGGQKQRIAIARALIRKPQILLLDEATSALDYESEAAVQEAIDNISAMKNITTIIVAHRLSTIKNADKIVVFAPLEEPEEGARVMEAGTHDDLMGDSAIGVYKGLVQAPEVRPVQPSQQPSDEPIKKSPLQRQMDALSPYQSISRRESEVSEPSISKLIRTDSHLTILSTPLDVYQDTGDLKRLETIDPEEEEDPDNLEAKKDLYYVPSSRLWLEMHLEWPHLAGGILLASAAGAIVPCISIILSNAFIKLVLIPVPSFPLTKCHNDADCPIDTFCRAIPIFPERHCSKSYFPGHGPSDVRDGGHEILVAFAIIGSILAVARGGAVGLFGYVSQKLNRRLKHKIFRSYLRMDSAYFDDRKKQVGVLVERLATDPILIKNVTGDYYALVFASFASMAAGLGIALNASVQLTLVVMAPLALLGVSVLWSSRRHAQKKVILDTASGKIVNQALNSVRTVFSCTAERSISKFYEKYLNESYSFGVKNAAITGVQNGLSQFMIQAAIAFSYWYGSVLLKRDDADGNAVLDPKSMFRVIIALQTAGQTIGQSFGWANDTSKADIAISNIYELLDDERDIDPYRADGIRDVVIKGDITLNKVAFAYPSRPSFPVLRDISITIRAGQTVAFVGQSGSGKSSIIKLVERFYDPLKGEICIDNTNIKLYNLHFLRSQIGLVSQEPVLFQGTVFENVKYGYTGPPCTDGELQDKIVEACKKSNAHDFIMDFPDGYQTMCGTKGAQVSGGQKQRIAIARALLKNPHILLLDEATSALDNKSEKVVQEALDSLMAGRTTLVVAHRLSTIQNSDQIVVLQKGEIAEKGTHQELMQIKDGIYHGLYLQSS